MKINELIHEFTIHQTNEEKDLLKRMQDVRPFNSYSERERLIIENLIRKALVSKIVEGQTVMVVATEYR